MARVWLHIGHGKTGSSALQAGLRAERGWSYPAEGRAPEGDHNRLFPVDQPVFDGPALARIRAARAEARGDVVVFSSESLCLAEAPKVAQLAELFAGDEVRVLYYVRRQEELVESGFRQHQRGRLRVARKIAKTVEDYLATHWDSFDFLKRLAPWEAAFGRGALTVRLYARETCAGDICADAAVATGLDIRDTGYRANPSLDVPLTRALMLYREREPDPERQMAFRRGLEAIVAEHGPHPARFVTEALATRIRAGYAASNAELARRYLDARAGEILTRIPTTS